MSLRALNGPAIRLPRAEPGAMSRMTCASSGPFSETAACQDGAVPPIPVMAPLAVAAAPAISAMVASRTVNPPSCKVAARRTPRAG